MLISGRREGEGGWRQERQTESRERGRERLKRENLLGFIFSYQQWVQDIFLGFPGALPEINNYCKLMPGDSIFGASVKFLFHMPSLPLCIH